MIMSSLVQKTVAVETTAIFGYDAFEQSVGENIKSETEKISWLQMEHNGAFAR